MILMQESAPEYIPSLLLIRGFVLIIGAVQKLADAPYRIEAVRG